MKTLDRLAVLLRGEAAQALLNNKDSVREVRIRAERPVNLVGKDNDFYGEPVPREELRRILLSLMDFSFYSKEEELKRGYFTLRDGSRVGVCGQIAVENDCISSMVHISSVCIRLSREIKGCASGIIENIFSEGRVESTLVVSPPGYGKTTCLRDIARSLSDRGLCIGISDERHEIAACNSGVPTMDVGRRSDVLDGGPKWMTILQLVRTMSPDVIITDEIGNARDGYAIDEAKRCGVSVIASAHGQSLDDIQRRASLRWMINSGVFSKVVLLGGKPGNVEEIRKCI